MALDLPRSILDSIYVHAEAGYPNEVCGLIFAERDVDAYPNPLLRPCENCQDQLHALDPDQFPKDARTAYHFGIADMQVLEQSLHSDHPARIVYHSHIEAGARLSPTDIAAAVQNGRLLYPVDQLLIDVRKDGAHGARLFRYAGRVFVEVNRWERFRDTVDKDAYARTPRSLSSVDAVLRRGARGTGGAPLD